MRASEVQRAVAAGMACASALDLRVEDAVVLHNSNRLAVRLLPCEVLARVAPAEAEAGAEFEVLLARRLAETDSPVAELEPRVEPRVYLRDDFAVTLWTYHRAIAPGGFEPAEYAEALERLHAGMRRVAEKVPHFTERVAEAQWLVGHAEMTPELLGPDRDLLSDTLQRFTDAVVNRGAGEQLLHGEPHPGNLLRTEKGLLFVDLETICRGPVEFDVAHAPEEVGQAYPAAAQDLCANAESSLLRGHNMAVGPKRPASEWAPTGHGMARADPGARH